MLKFKGAIFDMDGLMIDSERLVFEIWRDMLKNEGMDFTLDIFKGSVGLRSEDTEKNYKSVFGQDFDYAGHKQRSRAQYIACVEKYGVPPKKGLYEIFDFLEKNGCKTALATSTSSQTALMQMKKLGLYNRFSAFVCGDDVKNGKPDPEVFLTAAEKLGLSPCDCVVFEDSPNGIRAAHAAEMTSVMVPDLVQPTDEIKNMANFVCKDLLEAMKILN